MQKEKGVSVVICCYNSAGRLGETLRHLALQTVPKNIAWEIVLVDNASTDNTTAFARKTWNEKGNGAARLTIVAEDKKGQMHARRKGVETAAFDIIVFCDDDNWLSSDYVFLAASIMEDNTIGALGGCSKPATDALSYPDWFAAYEDKYAITTDCVESKDVSQRGFVLGAGLITRSHLFLSAFSDEYPTLLPGRNGAQLSTGDDFEYCKRLLLAGFRLFVDVRLTLVHFIPKERLTIEYRERLMEGIGQAGNVLRVYDQAIALLRRHGHKSGLRLALLAPLRIFFSEMKLSKRNLEEEALLFFYLLPFYHGNDKVKSTIKKFIRNRKTIFKESIA